MTISDIINKAGSQSALARMVGVTPQAVQRWHANGQVPLNKAVQVALVLGLTVTQVRPDLMANLEKAP